MKLAMSSLLLTAVLACAAVAHADEPTPRIQQEALLERMENKDASMIILDVRTPEEFAAGHIAGAVNIPYTHLPARLSELTDAGDKDIVLYCATGVRAERAAERMREQDLPHSPVQPKRAADSAV
jgi:phage shock protein E